MVRLAADRIKADRRRNGWGPFASSRSLVKVGHATLNKLHLNVKSVPWGSLKHLADKLRDARGDDELVEVPLEYPQISGGERAVKWYEYTDP